MTSTEWTLAGRSGRPLNSGPYAGAELLLLSEEVTDDNTKLLDFDDEILSLVSNASCAEVLWIFIEFTAEAGGGARQPFVQIRDAAADTVGGIGIESTINASGSQQIMVGSYLEQIASTLPDHERLPSNLMLFPGMDMRIAELGAVNANDDNIVHIQLAVYS